MSKTERVPVALDEALHWDLRQWMSEPSAPETQREALGYAVAVWLEIENPTAVLTGSEALRDALDTRFRVLYPDRYEQIQRAQQDLNNALREESDDHSSRPEEGASHKPVHVSQETHQRLSDIADQTDRSRKECLGEAVRLWTELKHWGETRDAREALREIRDIVHPPRRSRRDAMADDD